MQAENTARQGPGPPQRRLSNIHTAAHTMAGDLHTTEHTKKDAKEVCKPADTVDSIAVYARSILRLALRSATDFKVAYLYVDRASVA